MSDAPGPRDHRHVFGVRGNGVVDDLFHEHRRGEDNHEHVLRDGTIGLVRSTVWHDGERSRTTMLGEEVDVEPAPIVKGTALRCWPGARVEGARSYTATALTGPQTLPNFSRTVRMVRVQRDLDGGTDYLAETHVERLAAGEERDRPPLPERRAGAPDDAVLLGAVLRRFLTGDETYVGMDTDPHAGDVRHLTLDGTLYGITPDERDAITRALGETT